MDCIRRKFQHQSGSSSSGVEHGFAVSRVRCSNQCLSFSFFVFCFRVLFFSNMLVSEAEVEAEAKRYLILGLS